MEPRGRDPVRRVRAGAQPRGTTPAACRHPRRPSIHRAQDYRHSWPVFLPDGRRFLFLAQSKDPAQTAVYQGTLGSTEIRRAFAGDPASVSPPRMFVTLSKGLLIAQPYDAERAQISGPSTTIAERHRTRMPHNAREAPCRPPRRRGRLQEREPRQPPHLGRSAPGRRLASFPTRADYHHPWLSPDETRVVVEKTDPATGRHGIWVLDLSRGTTSRLLLDATGAHRPIWSPDGRRIGFGSNRLGGHDLYETASDGRRKRSAGHEFEGWRRGSHRTGRSTAASSCTKPDTRGRPTSWFSRSRPRETRWGFSKRWRMRSRGCSPRTSAGSPTRQTNPVPRKCMSGRSPMAERDGRSRCTAVPRPAGAATGRSSSISGSTAGSCRSPSTPRRPRIETGPPRPLFDTGIRGGFLDRRNQYLVTKDAQRFLVNLARRGREPRAHHRRHELGCGTAELIRDGGGRSEVPRDEQRRPALHDFAVSSS